MEIENDGVVQHPYFTVTLVNGGTLVPGKIGNAVSLDGRGAYVDLGEHADRCFGNLNLCKHGLTTTMWVKAKELTDKTYFLSGPSYSLFYRNGRLVAKHHTATKSWTVSTRKFRKDKWYHIAMSWHPVQGLSLYIDDKKVAESNDYQEVQADEPESSNVYIGRAIEDSKKHLTAKVLVDEVQYYYAPIDQLKATGEYREGKSPEKSRYHYTGLKIRI